MDEPIYPMPPAPDAGMMPGPPGPPGALGQASAQIGPDQLTRATMTLDQAGIWGGQPATPADEALDRFRELAIQWQPDVAAYRKARQEEIAARQRMFEIMNNPRAAEAMLTPWEQAAPWFAMSKALATPGPGVLPFANALSGYTDTYSQAMDVHRKRMLENAKLKHEQAKETAQAERAEITGAATNLRSLAALERAKATADRTQTGRRFVNVPNVGLVDTQNVDQEGRPIVVLSGENIPKLNLAIRQRVEQEAKTMEFGSPAEREAWIETRVGTISSRLGVGAPGGVPRAAPGAQTAEPGATTPVTAPTAPVTPGEAPVPGAKPKAPESKFSGYLPPAPTPGGPALKQPVDIEERKAAAKEGAKNAEETYQKDIVVASNAANDLIDEANRWRSIKTPTGRLGAAKEAAGAWMEAFGLDNKVVKEAKDLQKLNEILMRRTQRGLALQKGVQTEGDAQREQTAGAQIKNTVEANDFILRNMVSTAERMKEKQRFYDEYRERRGSLVGAEAGWRKWVDDHPRTAMVNGKLVFHEEFVPALRKANPGATDHEINVEWRRYSQGATE